MEETDPTTIDEEKLKLCLESQLSELEVLQSMFVNPGEIRFDDQTIVTHIKNYINNKIKIIPASLDFTINLSIDNSNFELCVSLPHDYPEIVPDIFVRNNKQNRDQQRKINADLKNYIQELERDICVYSAVTWLQDNGAQYIVNFVSNDSGLIKIKNNECARYWIYSHHIYNKTKRREILNLASEYELTGFCLPGKPGVVCIEGLAEDCINWWTFIKSMCWKKIVVKFVEEETKEVHLFRKFKKFEELGFQTEGNRGNHMSLGDLVKYLDAHQCPDRFKDIFGLEGKAV